MGLEVIIEEEEKRQKFQLLWMTIAKLIIILFDLISSSICKCALSLLLIPPPSFSFFLLFVFCESVFDYDG